MTEEQNEEYIENESVEEESSEQDIEARLKAQQEELEKLKKKDYNFRAIKERVEEQQKIIDNLKKERESLSKEQEVTNVKSKLLDEMVGDDVELNEKVLHYYNKMKVDDSSEDSVRTAISDALILAKKSDSVQNPINKAASIDSPSPGIGEKRSGPESQASKELRRAFKISDEDKNKYGSEGWQPRY